jgi:hypothetical protein
LFLKKEWISLIVLKYYRGAHEEGDLAHARALENTPQLIDGVTAHLLKEANWVLEESQKEAECSGRYGEERKGRFRTGYKNELKYSSLPWGTCPA